jgi:hypothetical protein
MRAGFFLIIVLALVVSCKKDQVKQTVPVVPVKKVVLKDMVLSNLPSPYYHFEYAADSSVRKASFASDFNMYDVFYSGGRISEIRSNTLVNHDTLRYDYDNTGKLSMIRFINQSGVNFRRVMFSYAGQQLKEIGWEHKDANLSFINDRTLKFVYFPDGNVKDITELRPAINGQPAITFVTSFDQYDNKVNVDDFSLIHDSFHDHLFLLSGIRLQKNNPGKEVRTGDGTNYTATYTYTNNTDGTPIVKSGSVFISAGSNAGQTFQVSSSYTYY